jgi:hypothetical protein
MRTQLSKYRYKNPTFVAAVGRRGTITRNGVQAGEAVCLEFLTTENHLVADHLWIPVTVDHSLRFLHHGDVIRFKAKVLPYSKGYAGNGMPTLHDFRLTELREIEIVDRLDSDMSDRNSDTRQPRSQHN